VAEAVRKLPETGLPAIIRPAFTMGGTGGGVAYNLEEFEEIVRSGLSASPTNEVLVDESLLGWKEYEMEVVRDKADNCIIICAIENIDPMGVHTGDFDYVVTKIPRFAFEKFPGAEPVLTTAMRSVGEAMAIGRTFTESLQKALRSLETDLTGLNEIIIDPTGEMSPDELKNAMKARLSILAPDRLLVIAQAFRQGFTVDKIYQYTGIDHWFLRQIQDLINAEEWLKTNGLPQTESDWRAIKAEGFADARIAELTGKTGQAVRKARHKFGVRPVYKRVDTCAAEFQAKTPYMYSTYEVPSFGGKVDDEARVSNRDKVMRWAI